MQLPDESVTQGSAVARTVLQVFLSSTAADLKPHRDALHAKLARIEFLKVIRQEDFGAQSVETVQYCCDKARRTDLFVGLIGIRRGWEPTGDKAQRSITELEYDSAKASGQPQYLWVSPDDFPVPGNLREGDAQYARQLSFRARVTGERIVSQRGFASPEALAAEITEQLLAHIVTGDLIGLLRPDLAQASAAQVEDQKPAMTAAVEKLAEDKDVDLLALARNPQRTDLATLEAKLTARAEAHQAASAEYWRHIGALAFFHNTQKALSAYHKAMTLDPSNADVLRFLGELQRRLGDLEAAGKTFAALTQLGRQTGDKRAESSGLLRTGWLHHDRGEMAAAEATTARALRLAELADWPEGMARAYRNLGIIHQNRDDLTQAEEMQLKALALEEQLGNRQSIADVYVWLGNIHLSRRDLAKAEEMHRAALMLHEEVDNKQGMADAYGNLGIIYCARHDFAEAEQMHYRSLALDQELGRKEGIAEDYSNLGALHYQRGDLVKAEEMHRKSLALHEELGHREGIADDCLRLALIHEQRGEKRQLCDHLVRAHAVWQEMGLPKRAADARERIKRAGCASLRDALS